MANHLKPSHLSAKVLSVFLALALLVSVLPTGSAAAQTCSNSYVVVAGDTISGIALKYGTTVEAMAAENNLSEPYTLIVGQSLCIPSSATGTGSTTTTSTTSTTTSTTTKKVPTISVIRYNNYLSIEMDNYTKNTTYYITLDRSLRDYGGRTRIGRIRTNKEGSGGMYYKLTRGWREEDLLYVCFKNVRNNSASCVQVVNSGQ
jgi:LysM repeat protein